MRHLLREICLRCTCFSRQAMPVPFLSLVYGSTDITAAVMQVADALAIIWYLLHISIYGLFSASSPALARWSAELLHLTHPSAGGLQVWDIRKKSCRHSDLKWGMTGVSADIGKVCCTQSPSGTGSLTVRHLPASQLRLQAVPNGFLMAMLSKHALWTLRFSTYEHHMLTLAMAFSSRQLSFPNH